ncbi:MAG: LamG-like jellyroll fold domain-containing protein [Verrucomicrobiales bacterium]
MKRPTPRSALSCLLAVILASLPDPSTRANDQNTAPLRAALLFHASFDAGADADFARGDRLVYHAPALDKRQDLKPGLPESGEVVLAESVGRSGHSLHFTKTKAPVVCFKAPKNFPPVEREWAATLSFWLNVDPAGDLAPGFCDPIQVTSKKWDDAALFVEFEKRPEGIPFRLGVYADTPVWNPHGKKWEDIPAAEKPLVTVTSPPFGKDKWTHVAVTLSKFNTGRPDGVARLFLDGQSAGEISPRTQTFTWDPDRSLILLGLGYAGKMDDLACFDRALTPAEVAQLQSFGTDLRKLHSKK